MVWGFKCARLTERGSNVEHLLQHLARARDFKNFSDIYLRTSCLVLEKSQVKRRDGMTPISKGRGNIGTGSLQRPYTCEMLVNGN